MCDNNKYPFIATLNNLLLAPALCDRFFSIVMSMNLGHTCLFHKGFFAVYFGDKEKNSVTLSHNAQKKYAILVKTKEKDKSKKIASRKKFAL